MANFLLVTYAVVASCIPPYSFLPAHRAWSGGSPFACIRIKNLTPRGYASVRAARRSKAHIDHPVSIRPDASLWDRLGGSKARIRISNLGGNNFAPWAK